MTTIATFNPRMKGNNMKFKTVGGVLLGALLSLLVVDHASAHTFSASDECSGLSWQALIYNAQETNSIVVTIDAAVAYSDASFGTTDIGSIPWSQTVDHSWRIVVDAPGTRFDHDVSDTQKACQPPATTTTVEETTTTVAETTTTVAESTSTTTPPTSSTPTETTDPATSTTVETAPPPTPPTSAPPSTPTTECSTGVTNEMGGCEPVGSGTLPRTGSGSNGIALVALALIGLGLGAVVVARRRVV